MCFLHQRPFMHMLTTLLLVHAVVHSSHGLHVSYTFEWSASITSRQVVQLHLGDELVLSCAANTYSEIVQQTRAQVDACDNSVGNPNGDEPDRVNFCSGNVDTVSILLQMSSENLQDSIVFESGKSYYYTSYSLINATFGDGLFGRTSEGLCSTGVQLELQILEDPTTTVDNEAPTTEGLNDTTNTNTDNTDPVNVDNGNTDPTIGGPGVTDDSNPPVIGGLNGASRMGCTHLSLTTIISVLFCVLLSKVLY